MVGAHLVSIGKTGPSLDLVLYLTSASTSLAMVA